MEQLTEIALIDLSSIAFPAWMTNSANPDPDATSTEIVKRVRILTANHPKVAICCDKGKSFRHELNPTYKAQREAQPAAYHHQVALAKERLAADGYPVWTVAGFEADDLIATAAAALCGVDGVTVLIMSADKDLLQLVNDRVRVLSVTNGTIYDAAAVVAKFGVTPGQVCDYLALVGDAADNVKGAAGIGPKKASDLLREFGTLAGIYDALTHHGTKFKPAMATSLREFQPRAEDTRKLIALRTDVDLPFGELDNDRAANAAPMEEPAMPDVIDISAPTAAPAPPASPTTAPAPAAVVVEAPKAAAPKDPASGPPTVIDVPAAAPVEFERQLEPRSLPQAIALANHMFAAKMFNGYGTAQAVLSTVLAGRELGLQAVASLRAFHVIEGKHALAADAMRGLVLRSGQAKYFRVTERTAERATFVTHRNGDPEPISLSYSIAEARAAFGFTPGLEGKALAELEGKWARSGWGKHTADMLAARASSKLARLVYADILFGLYAPEELSETVAA